MPNQIVSTAGNLAGFGAGHLKRQRRRGPSRHPIADIGKGDEAIDEVIPVGSPPGDMQIEVDLGGCKDADRGQAVSAATSLGRDRQPAIELGLDRLDVVLVGLEL